MSELLSAQLARLDGLLPVRAPRVHAGLCPGASPEALTRLADACFGGALPEELGVWFAWHDGQRGADAISPESNYTLHSIESALRTHALLSAPGADVAQPWSAAWLPLLENGAGDHLVYADGALLSYRHDDAARPVRWASLGAWAKACAAAWSKVKPRKIPLPGAYAWEPAAALMGWQDGVRLDPSAIPPEQLPARFLSEIAALAALPAGAVLRYQSGLCHVVIKLGPDRWLTCFGGDEDEALAQWASFSERPPSARSGYYCTDEAMWMTLSSVFRTAPRPALARGVEVSPRVSG